LTFHSLKKVFCIIYIGLCSYYVSEIIDNFNRSVSTLFSIEDAWCIVTNTFGRWRLQNFVSLSR